MTARTRALDLEWEEDALALKTRIEVDRVLEDPKSRASRLVSYMVSHGGSRVFTRIVVGDSNGKPLIRFPLSERTGFDPSGSAQIGRAHV